MALFKYHALDATGKRAEGLQEAATREVALDQLALRNLFVTRIQEAESDRTMRWSLPVLGRRVSPMDMVLFYRRLATLVAADIPLLESLKAIEGQTDNPFFKTVLAEVKEDVRHGKSFSDSLARHPRVFPELMISMTRVGETGGILSPVLEQLAEFTQKDGELRTEVRTALAYPAIVLLLAVCTVFFLMMTVVPKLETMFEGMRVTLPLPTRILMGASGALTSYGPWLLVLLVAVGFGFSRWLRRPAAREKFDSLKLGLPLVGTLIRKSIIARFSRSLGALVKGGVPVMEGLDVVNRVLGNVVLARALDRVKERVRKGDSMAHGMGQESLFPEMVRYMISAGEESGKLDEMLMRIADVYDMETRQVMKVLVNLLPPVLILMVAAVVGFIAFALLMPIFQINQMIG